MFPTNINKTKGKNMKLNNKILYLTAAGVISTLTPANTNAQTFYQCMPITCSDGQYIKDGKCTSCPAGTFQKGNNRATSCTACLAGTYSNAGASSCTTCPTGSYCPNGTYKYACADGYYQDVKGSTACKQCTGKINITYARYSDIYKTKTFSVGDSSTCSNSVFGNPESGDKWCCAKQNGKAMRPKTNSDWTGAVCVAAHEGAFKVSCDKVSGETYAEGPMGRIWAHDNF